jgi:hypothetical protein
MLEYIDKTGTLNNILEDKNNEHGKNLTIYFTNKIKLYLYKMCYIISYRKYRT